MWRELEQIALVVGVFVQHDLVGLGRARENEVVGAKSIEMPVDVVRDVAAHEIEDLIAIVGVKRDERGGREVENAVIV